MPRRELPQVSAKDTLSKENERIAAIYAAGRSQPEDVVRSEVEMQFQNDPGRVEEIMNKFRGIIARREMAIDK